MIICQDTDKPIPVRRNYSYPLLFHFIERES